MIISKAKRLADTGEYYFSKKLEEVRLLNKAGYDVVNLGIGSPDLAPSPETIRAAKEALDDEKNHGYAAYRSSIELRQSLALWYEKTYGVKLDAVGEILPLLGSKEGILYTTMAFCDPGDGVLIPNPGYPAYRAVAKLLGTFVENYDLKEENNWLPDFEVLEKSDLSKIKIMWVNYPHMPTGKKPTPQLFEDLTRFARKHKILLCHDNPYSLVLNDDKPLSIFQFDEKKEVSLELNSFSKAFNMAGWRVGMLGGAKDVVDAVLQVKSNADSGMFTAIQMGAIAALNNSPRWHEMRNATLHERREIAYKIFDALDFSYGKDQVGLFVWAKAPADVPDVESLFNEILHEAHVFLTPGFIFGSEGTRFARASLCADTRLLTEALARVSSWSKNKVPTK